MHGDAVHRRRHAQFAHAEMDVAAGEIAGLDFPLVLGLGVVRRRQIGRAADHFRYRREQRVEHLAGGLTGGDLRVLGAEIVAHLGDHRVEVLRQVALEAALEFGAPVGGRGGETLFPFLPHGRRRATPACRHSA